MKDRNICKFITNANSDKLEINCFIYETNPEVINNPQKLYNHRIILVKKGEGIFRFDGEETAFGVGSLVLGFKDETLTVKVSEPCEYMYISFGGIRSDALFHRFCINKANRSFTGFDGVIPLWHNTVSHTSQANIDLASEGILLYTLSRLTETSTKQNDLINKIVEITEERFSDPDLSVTTLANELSYNTKYISHIFKEKMGTGYSEYLRTLRIKYAVSLLDHGIDSIKNVAFLSGFTDPLYFSTVFKKIIGKSPRDYKKDYSQCE